MTDREALQTMLSAALQTSRVILNGGRITLYNVKGFIKSLNRLKTKEKLNVRLKGQNSKVTKAPSQMDK